jgi:imidazolonepropionase-like amidohydrolase
MPADRRMIDEERFPVIKPATREVPPPAVKGALTVKRRPAPRVTVIRDAQVVDPVTAEIDEGVDLLIVGDRIEEVGRRISTSLDARYLDAGMRHVFPGLVDAHVHLFAASRDLVASARMPWSYVASAAVGHLKGMARRGFTTVRDTGGADWGLAQAIADGALGTVPQLRFGGPALSQTGGHGDLRGRGGGADPCCGLAKVCDGVKELRRESRQQIAAGASHLKVMLGGGIASELDRIDRDQFGDDEVRAVVVEAQRAGIYVTAHAYTPAAITRAARLGVRSIEHGNLIDQPTAQLMAERQMFLVPTLVTYEDLYDGVLAGEAPAHVARKLDGVREAGLRSISLAAEAGVCIVFGTDLLGAGMARQLEEFALRSEVLTPLEMFRSATVNAHRLIDDDETVGLLRPGGRADLVIADLDPTQESLEHLEGRRPEVIIGGQLVGEMDFGGQR